MTPTLLLLLTAAPCVVTGGDFSTRAPLELRPDGGAPVKVSLRNVRARAVLDGRVARVHVEHPLSFEATTRRLRLTVRSEVTLFDGGVVLREGTGVQWREGRGGTLAGDVIVEPDDDELETEDKPPMLTFVARALPCERFTLDLMQGEDPKAPEGDGPVFFTEALPLAMAESPRPGAPSFTLSSASRLALFFRLLSTRGPLAHVEYLGSHDRASLRGWVPKRALKALPPGTGFGHGSMCSGDHDVPMVFGRASAGGVPRHAGPLTLPPGTVLTVDCPTKREPERRCPAATVTAPLEATVRWFGGPVADVTLQEVLLDEGDGFSVDASAIAWPDAGVSGKR
ncbi:MAG: hypothetical protein JNJ54_01490 [Myxococcaceae bacterium]|nr:hypothetical protein [Myxococcaceae bacterium]